MCALILIFALAMSLVINLIERMIAHHRNEQAKQTTSEMLVPENKE